MEIMELLKSLFNGEALTFEQFSEKVNQSSDVKLGNLADGQYVDKHKYDELNTQLKEVNSQLKSANEKYSDYDPDWKSKLEQAQADGEKRLNDYKFEQSVEKAIGDFGAADLVSVKANLDMSSISQDAGGKISGLSEQLDKLKTDKPFLFRTEDKPEPKLNLGGATQGANLNANQSNSIKSAVADFYSNKEE